MGLFNIFQEANEEAHGKRLSRGFNDTIRLLSGIDEDLRIKALIGFMEKRKQLLSHMRDMTSKGKIDLGRKLQDEAAKTFDIHMSEACALWLAGAWLESHERTSDSAKQVCYRLDELVNVLDNEDSRTDDKQLLQKKNIDNGAFLTLPNITKCKPIKWFTIGQHSAVLVKDAPNIAGVNAPFKYVFVMALFCEGINLPIYYITAEEGASGGVFLCAIDDHGNRLNYGREKDWSNINIFINESLPILQNVVENLD